MLDKPINSFCFHFQNRFQDLKETEFIEAIGFDAISPVIEQFSLSKQSKQLGRFYTPS